MSKFDRKPDSHHDSPFTDLRLNRRSFLKYVGAGAGATLGLGSLGSFLACRSPGGPEPAFPGAWTASDGSPLWRAPSYPVPLPGDSAPKSRDQARLASFEVEDRLVLPEGFDYEVLAQWGEQFGPADEADRQIEFGYNNDYTGLVPIPGSANEFWLLVNHEYVSMRPFLAAEAEDGRSHGELRLRADSASPPVHRYGIATVEGWEVGRFGNRIDLAPVGQNADIPPAVRESMRRLSDRGLEVQGVSILRVRQRPDHGFEVVREARDHRRIATQSHANIEPGPDGLPPFRLTGPSALLIEEPPRGTFCNCSGGTTPWGTFLTCEENIQYQVNEEVSPAGTLIEGRRMWFGLSGKRVNGIVDDSVPEPTSVDGMGHAASRILDGRHYGWVCEVDPASGAMRKHSSLGRFRHENVTLRAEAGRSLAAYMGDDRRGGHVWKFVSRNAVEDPADPRNSELLEEGTLYVARFEADFSGRWIPLTPSTPLVRPEPEHCPTGHLRVPSRFVGGYVAVGDTERDRPELEVEQWISIVETYTGKAFAECTLGDLVKPELSGDETEDHRRRLGVILMDAFAMANAVGGTPTARPEDLEVHPEDSSVYIAFTDATDSSDGSPDERIFPDSRLESSRQYGAVFRLEEDGDDPAAETFGWGKLVASGEVAEDGGGFANADNLVFDPQGNLWMVTDITTSVQNFPTSRQAQEGTRPGEKQFPGVFGNNAMFLIPTTGPKAGEPQLFATGPMECEFCGPTFSPDGKALILAVQHPGENNAARTDEEPETNIHIIHDRNDQPFEQERQVPVGSNFPSGELGKAPRPAVVSITRKG